MANKEVPFGLKITPLYEYLQNQGGSFTGFGGYYMPVNFKEGIISEHQAVRNDSGLFDISHMGEVRINGNEAAKFLNYVSSNNINKISDNQLQYHIILQEDGGVVDDLIVYKFKENDFWLICNASNKDILVEHLGKILDEKKFDARVIDESDAYAAIAIQGPKSQEKLEQALSEKLDDIKYMRFKDVNQFYVSRSGYTGEDGFEVYGSPANILEITMKLVDLDVKLCGLGSRDTLRFEAGLPLFGHEMSNYISPVQAGMNFAIDFNKEEFIGKEALVAQRENLEEKIYGMELLDRGVLRQGYPIYDGEENVGYITSGFMIPGTRNSYATGLIKTNYKNGDELEVEVRNRRLKVRLRNKRFL